GARRPRPNGGAARRRRGPTAARPNGGAARRRRSAAAAQRGGAGGARVAPLLPAAGRPLTETTRHRRPTPRPHVVELIGQTNGQLFRDSDNLRRAGPQSGSGGHNRLSHLVRGQAHDKPAEQAGPRYPTGTDGRETATK